jgi:hypothetical protein
MPPKLPRVKLKYSLDDISIDATDLACDMQETLSYEDMISFVLMIDEQNADIDFTETLILELIKSLKEDDPEFIKNTLTKIRRAATLGSVVPEPKKPSKKPTVKRKHKDPEKPAATRFNQIDIVTDKDAKE